MWPTHIIFFAPGPEKTACDARRTMITVLERYGDALPVQETWQCSALAAPSPVFTRSFLRHSAGTLLALPVSESAALSQQNDRTDLPFFLNEDLRSNAGPLKNRRTRQKTNVVNGQ